MRNLADIIRIQFVGMASSEALIEYALSKFTKHEYLLNDLVNGDVMMTQRVKHKGVSKDFELDVHFILPGHIVHIEEVGEDMYAMIDTVADKVNRNLRKWKEKKQHA